MVSPDPSQAPVLPTRWRWAGPLVFAVVLAGALPSLPRGIQNWDNIVKLQLAQGLLEGRGLVLSNPTPDDAQYVVRGVDGRSYAGYPPLAAVLQVATLAAAPVLGDLREGAGTLLALAILGWALVAWGQAAGVAPEAAVAGAFLATLGTVLWPMAALGYDVILEALALVLILRAGTGPAQARRWAGAGLLLGLVAAARVNALVLGCSAAVLLLAQRPGGLVLVARRAAAFGLGLAPGLALVLWFNQVRFGAPFTFFQATALGSVDQLASAWFSRVHLEGMAGLLVSPGKGLLWYAPPLLGVVIAAFPLARRHRACAAALGAQLLASLLVFGAFRYWHGDWAWGPRYVAPLCVAVAPLGWRIVEWSQAAGPGPRLAAAAAGLLAISLQALPVVGRPVPTHFALVLMPLDGARRLVTSPITRPPVPEDNALLYFEPTTSPLVSLVRGHARRLADPRSAPSLWWALARAALVPLLAGLATWATWLRSRRGTNAPR